MKKYHLYPTDLIYGQARLILTKFKVKINVLVNLSLINISPFFFNSNLHFLLKPIEILDPACCNFSFDIFELVNTFPSEMQSSATVKPLSIIKLTFSLRFAASFSLFTFSCSLSLCFRLAYRSQW